MKIETPSIRRMGHGAFSHGVFCLCSALVMAVQWMDASAPLRILEEIHWRTRDGWGVGCADQPVTTFRLRVDETGVWALQGARREEIHSAAQIEAALHRAMSSQGIERNFVVELSGVERARWGEFYPIWSALHRQWGEHVRIDPRSHEELFSSDPEPPWLVLPEPALREPWAPADSPDSGAANPEPRIAIHPTSWKPGSFSGHP